MAKFTDEQIEQGLRALVLANGNTKLAQERLKGAGFSEIPSDRTFRDWKNIYSERLESLQEQRDVWVGVGLADQAEFMAATYAEAEYRLIQSVLSMSDEELAKLSPNVRMMAAQRATIGKGINIDKSRLLRDKPTKINRTESSVAELMATLERRFPELQAPETIEGDAKEVDDEDED